MTPVEFVSQVLDPGIAWCKAVPGWNVPFDERARVMLLAIAGQESAWSDRIQSGNGPAHSYWQMERGGGVAGVLHHPDTEHMAQLVCQVANIPPIATNVWGFMATAAGDNLSVAFSRLLLWSDPRPLPDYGDEQAAALCYRRNWRPGKWRPADWPKNYAAAMDAMAAVTSTGGT